MTVTRGLIIADPWIELILEGRKDWEMRSQATAHRGWFGLIRKGSGLVVGLARLIECGKALGQAEMIASMDHHRIPEAMIVGGEVAKWVIPWKLADILRLDAPIPYAHKSGAVTWVTFDTDVTSQLDKQLESCGITFRRASLTPIRSVVTTGTTISAATQAPSHYALRERPSPSTGPLADPEQWFIGRSRLTGGNIRNNHFYLTDFIDSFPADSIGGKNRKEAAARQIEVDWGGPSLVLTDIDKTKRMFRKRGWVGQFFAASNAQEGDSVVLTSVAPYKVGVRLERALDE